MQIFRDSQIKVDSLRERHAGSIVDGAGGSAHVLLPTVGAGLPAAAGLLLTAECAADLCAGVADVDVDDAAVGAVRADPPEGVGDVLGEEAAAEALRNAVVDGNRLLQRGVLLDKKNGTEVLVLQEGRVLGRLYDGRLDEVARPVESLPAVEHLSALSLDAFESGVVDLEGGGVVERPAECGGVERVSDLDRGISLDELVDEVVVVLLVDEESPEGGAALPAGAHCREGAGLEGHLEVGVLVDYGGVVAAQLQQHSPEALLHVAPHDAADPAGPGEGNQGHSVVVAHLLPDVSAALQHGEHVGVDAVFLKDVADDLRAGDGDEGGGGRALPGDGVAADEGDGCVPGEDRVGEVEGGDDSDRAQRVPNLHHEVLLALGVEDLSADGAGQSAGHVAHVDRLLHLAQALRKDLAHLQRHQLAERLLLGPEGLADLPHDVSSGRHRH